ncbi:NPCBM/NEW2 domain-containing protein [Streptomyces sp. NPDC086080]|uniref:NPCBM/NEW2 domain-containing protein n=1 Tax=Streptomyces sp. NPDC086080 TaxID=3365748 RepID=UPI0037D09F7B
MTQEVPVENRPENRNADASPDRLPPDTIEGFAQRVRDLFTATRMSTKQFQRLHGFPDGFVSKCQNGKQAPPIEFVMTLIDEAKIRGGLRDEAADQYLREYGQLLRALDNDGRGHHLHRTWFAQYELTMSAMRHEQELLEVLEENRRLEVEAASTTSKERKAVIQAQIQELAVRQRNAIAQRDAVLQELADLRQTSPEMGADAPQATADSQPMGAGLHTSQRPTALQDAPSPVPHPADGGAHAPRVLTASDEHAHRWQMARFLVGAFVVLVLGIMAISRFTDKDDRTAATPGDTSTQDGPKGGEQQPATTPASEAPSTARTPSSTPTAAKPLKLGDLNFTGDNWVQGSWSLDGRPYPKSIAWASPCSNEQRIMFKLPDPYQRFTAVVGLGGEADAQDRDYPANFNLWADFDGDGQGDPDELVASPGVMYDKPANIDVDIKGATQLILKIRVTSCGGTPLVWGSPEVR